MILRLSLKEQRGTIYKGTIYEGDRILGDGNDSEHLKIYRH